MVRTTLLQNTVVWAISLKQKHCVINMASVYDLMILVIVSGITYLFAFTSRKIARVEGIMMLMIYAADVIFATVR